MKYHHLSVKVIALILLIALSACSRGSQEPEQTVDGTPPVANPTTTGGKGEPVTLSVMTHDSFAASDQVIQAFEQENNVKLQFIQAGDAGTALNKAILSKDKPLADVFYGVDNTYLSRALDEGIFEPYQSPALSDIPSQYQLDPQNRALPVDWGDVCLNYDKKSLQEKSIQPPQTLEDLLKPEYKGLIVVENPASSSPGLAFLLATIGHFGEDKYIDYWKGLSQNGLKVVNDWETAYDTEFSGGPGKGQYPLVVSYSSSPPFEIIGEKQAVSEPSTAAMVGDETCFRQIEFVGILQGTTKRALAEKWVDYMLSTTFQEDMPLQMYVFPVNSKAKLDPTFQKYLAIPEKTAEVTPEAIAANRDKWLQDWSQAVLHR
jgi:thiamine transport system substrate-binding protein